MIGASNQKSYQGSLLLNEPMSQHTSWRVGGVADKFYTPKSVEDLSCFLKSLPSSEAVYFLGLGSNLLVRDKGIRGTVISLKGSLSKIELLANNSMRIGAGASCAKLARSCHRNNLIGGEFFAGIPGLVGGALAMNAGAFAGETWPLVKSVMTIDKQGNTYIRSADEYEVGYRKVSGHSGEWFVSAIFQFSSGDGEQAAQRIKQLLEKRAESQPIGLPSCGSVFKNPDNDYAARLIEACGLKCHAIGDAVVSVKHANFIINAGNASATDIESLINYVHQVVKQKQGIDLSREVKIIGENR